MTTQLPVLQIGVDVSKAELVINLSDNSEVTIANSQSAINKWLSELPGKVEIAMEATGGYHLALALLAHKKHHTVFMLNGYRLNRYRECVGVRAKTDRNDARLLRRYLQHERGELNPWKPAPQAQSRLQALLSRRSVVVSCRVRIEQSMAGMPELKQTLAALKKELHLVEKQIEKMLRDLVKEAGWEDDMKRCQAIEGVGPLTSIALTSTFHRGRFSNSDAFIAYLGLDVRVRDSGKMRGKRKLTKQGNSEIRRLLYLAAMHAKRKEIWREFYDRHINRGLAPVQVLTILARKLARVAFSLMKNQTEYRPKQLA